MITNQGRAVNVLFDRLQLAVKSGQDEWGEDEPLKSVSLALLCSPVISLICYWSQMTLLHNMSEASTDSTYWTPIAVIQALLGIWFAASHQPWIVSSTSEKQCLSLLN